MPISDIFDAPSLVVATSPRWPEDVPPTPCVSTFAEAYGSRFQDSSPPSPLSPPSPFSWQANPFSHSIPSSASSSLVRKPPRSASSISWEERRRNKDDDYIPRPANAFILFRSKCCKDHQQAQDEGSIMDGLLPSSDSSNSMKRQRQADLSKTISQKWQSLTSEDRQYWEKLAKEKKKEHEQKYPNYVYRPYSSRFSPASFNSSSSTKSEKEGVDKGDDISFAIPEPIEIGLSKRGVDGEKIPDLVDTEIVREPLAQSDSIAELLTLPDRSDIGKHEARVEEGGERPCNQPGRGMDSDELPDLVDPEIIRDSLLAWSDSTNELIGRTLEFTTTANSPKRGLVTDYLAKIKDGCRKVLRSGKSEWMQESKPPPSKSKHYRRQKITIVVNAQQKNCGNVTHVQTENSHNDSSHVEVSSGNTHNTNSGSGTFNNTIPSDPTVSLPMEDPPLEYFQTPPPPPQDSQDGNYEGPLYWIVYVWSWVPCFSWDGWFSRFCGWAPQLVPQVLSRVVHG